jgi:putative phosphoribosyl transferase
VVGSISSGTVALVLARSTWAPVMALSASQGVRETKRTFRDRTDAGRQLARAVAARGDGNVVVLGLPRGGVPVAAEVAGYLAAPLDVILVRKLGVPGQPELAMGAIGEGGVQVVNDQVVRAAGITSFELQLAIESELAEITIRAQRYRKGRERVPLEGRTVVIVDDGLATGATARAAMLVARANGATRVVLAIPVAPHRSLRMVADIADEVVCLSSPAGFYAVGQAYRHFDPTSDDEVVTLLQRTADRTDGVVQPNPRVIEP